MTNKIKVMAIASHGGHWCQLMRLSDAFTDDLIELYLATTTDLLPDIKCVTCTQVKDVNFSNKLSLLSSFIELLGIYRKLNPDVIISTGAAPGLIMCFIGKIFGSKTIWIDSIANSDQLSLSGRVANYFVDHSITQWEHLSKDNGRPSYIGSVI